MPIDIERVTVKPLTDLHVRGAFSCAYGPIENFCRGRLADANRESKLRAFVAVGAGQPDVLGFYYLVTTSVEHAAVHQGVQDGFSDLDKIPAMYLGMLGVHQPLMRQGLGTLLMQDAFRRVVEVSVNAGFWALTLDALNEEAVGFYERFDFRRFAAGSREMYLPLGTIRQVFAD